MPLSTGVWLQRRLFVFACLYPIASAIIAVTKLLMLTPSFSACAVSFA